MKQPKPWNQATPAIAYHLGMAAAYRNMRNRWAMRLQARMAAAYIKDYRKWKP